MISVDSLLYKTDQKLNKLSSNSHQEIQKEDKILALNEAQIKLIKRKVTGQSTSYGIGLDGFRKRYEDLQNLVEEYKDHSLDLKEVDTNIHQWEASLAALTPTYLFYIDSYVIADKGRCKDRLIKVNPDLTKHADILLLLDNSHYKPSFEYQETFNTISLDKINIYTDGTFTPKKIYVSYLRYPKYIDVEGYINLDGNPSTKQDCELEAHLEDELVDIAVQDLAQYTENVSAAQAAQFRIQTNE
jgi:hypothetical protein